MSRPTTRIQWKILVALVVAGALGMTALPRAQEDNFFPDTKRRGRAAVEYKDKQIHVLAAYYYSQRNHDSRWLLIEAAVSTTEGVTFDRGNIRLVAPSGRESALPEQARVLEDRVRIRTVVQNASASRHNLLTYFPQQTYEEPLQLFSLGSGAVLTNFVTDNNHVAFGDLFFEAPNGLWEDGTYRLVFERDGVRAVLPIELE